MLTQTYRLCGRVQGVGCRFTATKLALSMGLKGTVKNEEDGSVTLQLQASPEKVAAFFQAFQSPSLNPWMRIDTITLLREEDLPFMSDFSPIY